MSDKGKSYTFQQITITQKFDGASKNVTPPILSWSNKTIYAGNGNYSDKFKDLIINEQIVDSGRGGSGRGSKGRGGGRDNEGTPQKLILTIKSSAKKGTTYKCIANIPSIAKDKLVLDDFVNALLDKHDRILAKIDEENGGVKLQHSKPVSKRSGIGNNSRLSRTNKNSIRGASSATKKHNTITPHANQQLNVYQKTTKRPSSGSFQSPGRPVNGADSKKGSGHTHYDPALEDGSPEVIKGNVVESPANKKLKFNLSDKSPRNATPTKLRTATAGEFDNADSDDFDDKLDEELDKRMGKKKKNKVSLDPNEEEGGRDDNGIVKRRRLQKMTNSRSNSYGDSDEEDSDVEFDTEPVTVKKRNVKKRLDLSINKNSEEQVTEDDGDNTEEDESKGGEKEGGIAKNSLFKFGFAAKSSAAAGGGGAAKKEGSAKKEGANNKKKARPSSPTPSDTYYALLIHKYTRKTNQETKSTNVNTTKPRYRLFQNTRTTINPKED